MDEKSYELSSISYAIRIIEESDLDSLRKYAGTKIL